MENYPPKVRPSLKLFRPFSITAGTLVLFVVWNWIDMSNADYRTGYIDGGRTTSGWFLLGSPFVLGIALPVSMSFSFVARRTRPVVGWVSLLVVFIPLITIALVKTTPTARLSTALEMEPPVGTRIQQIKQSDSFNDGITISGVCSTDPQFVNKVISTHGLEISDYASVLQQAIPDESIPDDGKVFAGDELVIFYDADRSLLYFSRRIGQQRPPGGAGR